MRRKIVEKFIRDAGRKPEDVYDTEYGTTIIDFVIDGCLTSVEIGTTRMGYFNSVGERGEWLISAPEEYYKLIARLW